MPSPDAPAAAQAFTLRGRRVLLCKWMRRERLPDAIVIEHPRLTGGHLGAAADPEHDMVTFMSEAGLPARAVRTPWLDKHLLHEARKAELARPKPRCVMKFDCLIECGLRDGIAHYGQFCIDRQLAAAMRGEVDKGLFFRGSGKLPFGQSIRPVAELIDHLLGVPAQG